MNADETGIEAIVQQWQQAWNAGDMRSTAPLFWEDADFVNVHGSHWHTRGEIVIEHVKRHELQLKDSVFTPLAITQQRIATDTALLHIRWKITGDHDLDGTKRAPRVGLMSWLMLRDGEGQWRIRASHNTHVTASP
jgi:uncharacterized protein (TIGR02246 family)